MSDLRRFNFRKKSDKKLRRSCEQIEKELCYKVEEMIRYGLPRPFSCPRY